MNKNTTLLLVGGGAIALYLYSKSQANAQTAAQQQANTAQNAQDQATYRQAISSGGSFLQSLFGTGGGASGGARSGQPNYSVGSGYQGGQITQPGTAGYYTAGGGYVFTGGGGAVYTPPSQLSSGY